MLGGAMHRHHRSGTPRTRWFSLSTALPRIACFILVVTLFWLYTSLSKLGDTPVITPTGPTYKPRELNPGTTTFTTTPFFLRGTQEPLVDIDVTIATQLSLDRLDRLERLTSMWQGPVSAAIYIKTSDDSAVLESLVDRPLLQQFLDVHLLFENHTRYPVNCLRNLAITNARTSTVFLVDVDMIPSFEMRQIEIPLLKLTSPPKSVFVVPTFSTEIFDPNARLPTTKTELITVQRKQQVSVVNDKLCPKCHGPTNYRLWLKSDSAYEAEYKWIYEPYMVFNKTGFDERFKGYGFDKNTHVFHLAVAGFKFIVLPQPFLIHVTHDTALWDGPSQQQQLWEMLDIVCKFIPQIKKQYGYEPNTRLFDEPVGDAECYSKNHW